jgi:hypothetical protein
VKEGHHVAFHDHIEDMNLVSLWCNSSATNPLLLRNSPIERPDSDLPNGRKKATKTKLPRYSQEIPRNCTQYFYFYNNRYWMRR